MSYQLLFKQQDRIIWQLAVDRLELLVGMAAVSVGIRAELNTKSINLVNSNLSDSNLASSNNGNLSDSNYYFETPEDISGYRHFKNIPEENMEQYEYDPVTMLRYRIWMRSSDKFLYDLYTFDTAYFMQGVISLCGSFQVDFRNYIFKLPFDSIGNEFILDGYVMRANNVFLDLLDSDDYDIEEEDNENVFLPFDDTRDEL